MVRDADVLIVVRDRAAGGHATTIVALAEEMGVTVVTVDPVARAVVIAKR